MLRGFHWSEQDEQIQKLERSEGQLRCDDEDGGHGGDWCSSRGGQRKGEMEEDNLLW